MSDCGSVLEDRWRAVLDGVAEAARRAGRPVADVRLVAVSKFHSAEAVAALARIGQRDFGENYMQEARIKREAVAALAAAEPDSQIRARLEGVRWHAIGPIQTNKAREAAGRFSLIHTLASVRLAAALVRRLAIPENGSSPVQDCLIQVNIGEEPQKAGVDPALLPALAEALMDVSGVRVLGLMCLPPRCGEGAAARPYFRRMRELRDELEVRLGRKLPHLSMGMSGDYQQAVEEGATLVRVGTDIFGPRPVRG